MACLNFRKEFQISDHCASSSQFYSSVAWFSSCAIEEQLPIEKHKPSIHCKHRVGSHHLCRTHKKWAPTPYTVHSCLLELPPPACTPLYRCVQCIFHILSKFLHTILMKIINSIHYKIYCKLLIHYLCTLIGMHMLM